MYSTYVSVWQVYIEKMKMFVSPSPNKLFVSCALGQNTAVQIHMLMSVRTCVVVSSRPSVYRCFPFEQAHCSNVVWTCVLWTISEEMGTILCVYGGYSNRDSICILEQECMYVRMYTCTHTYMHTCAYVRTYFIWTHVYILYVHRRQLVCLLK